MSKQHTQGPWSVIDGHYPSFKEISGPSFKISVVMWATDLTEDDYRKRDADLHLISAAPDLLEALKACIPHLERDDHHTDALSRERPHYAAARAAIDKATRSET
jgi:hypothetical protein